MVNGSTYDVSVTLIGYTDENTTVTISDLTEEIINLIP